MLQQPAPQPAFWERERLFLKYFQQKIAKVIETMSSAAGVCQLVASVAMRFDLVAECGADLVDGKAQKVGGASHVTELKERPFPAIGFPFDDR